MSKDRKKLLHIHSSVNDKQPTPATLELGELGVNNAKGNAFISTKNSDGEVVRFSEDETIIGWMEQKEVFPYEGYMRGADNSQVDGVTEQDLLDNKSNLIIKLNQVVPENTDYSPYDEKVNGAKDIYGNLINPISSGGYKDGAGLAIDMSKYAMIGANPSFSSITTTCHATLNGTTEIKGKGDGCGSKFTVEVANACIDATDTLNEYGVNHSNFGTSCDGTKISNDTTLKGKKIFIDSPSGDLTVDIQACNHISGRTNDFVIRECQDNGGKVEIDTTDIDVSASTTDVKSCDRISAATDNYVLRECTDGSGKVGIDTTEVKVSASTTDVKSCDRISAITNDFQVKECAANGKAGISSTTINNSASTIDEKACTRISEVTNQFNITECTDGQGSVNVDTTSIDTTACTHNYNNTNDFKVTECTDGQGTTTIKSCKKFNVKSNDIVLEQCGNSGETKINSCKGISAITDNFIVEQCNSGKTHIHSCKEITLESKNITLTDGDCGSGQTTIEVNDLCLVGERKINVYGDETNVGLDCDDSKIATNTRVFGKGTLITTKTTPTTYASENNVETVAAQDIKENADRDINETAGRNINETATGNINESTTNGNINESAKNINNTASNDICDTAANNATFYGAVKTNVGINCNDTATAATTTVKGGKVIVDASTTDLGLTAKQDILESAERDITITANDDICETAGVNASFYAVTRTNLGINCDNSSSSTTTNLYGDTVNEVANTMNVTATTLNEEIGTETKHTSETTTITRDGNVIENNKNNVTINTTGTTDIISTGSTTIESKGNGSDMCISAADVAGFVGANKTNIGKNCADGGQTTTLNINGDTINETGNTVNISGATINKDGITNNNNFTTINTTANTENHTTTSFTVTTGDLCLTSTGDADFGGDTNTRIGTNCDGTGISNSTTIYASTAVTINAPTTNITGNTNISGDTIISGTATIGDTLIIKKGLEKTLSWSYGNVQSATADSTNFKEDKSFVIPQDANEINRRKVSWSYGDVSNASGGNYEPGQSADGSFVIPSCASHINRRTLSWSNGAANTGSYDPGASCDNTDSGTNIVIPSGLSHLTDWSNNCLNVANNLCVNGTVTATGGMYTSSDRDLKENITYIGGHDISKATRIKLKAFNYKNDPSNRKVYGVIAQDLEEIGLNELVHYDESGMRSVDYTGLLLLKLAALEKEIDILKHKLEEKNN